MSHTLPVMELEDACRLVDELVKENDNDNGVEARALNERSVDLHLLPSPNIKRVGQVSISGPENFKGISFLSEKRSLLRDFDQTLGGLVIRRSNNGCSSLCRLQPRPCRRRLRTRQLRRLLFVTVRNARQIETEAPWDSHRRRDKVLSFAAISTSQRMRRQAQHLGLVGGSFVKSKANIYIYIFFFGSRRWI